MQPKKIICLLNILRSLLLRFFSKRPYNRFVFLRPSGGVYETRLFPILLKAFYWTTTIINAEYSHAHQQRNRWSNSFSSNSSFSAIVAIAGWFFWREMRNKQRAQIRNSFFYFQAKFKLSFNWIVFFIFFIRLWRVVGKFAGFNIGHTRGTNTARQFYCTFGGRRLYSTEVRYQSR